ncbi:MAG: adenylosuccinate synthase [Candidatus Marinimicrobia bacterium]|nr:adenylosuccinate synthase [Candidatus Neomarinimicrobiota bacterium]|tara:strand:- start:21648 stop:22901 length:1254 start_codon:yes stop_codon:yes gene_type:complete
MSIFAVIGGQWGDEGKGKVVDLLSAQVDIVARYQGGANAGHTVYINNQKIVLHQVPSGILRKDCLCLLGNGMVIDPVELIKEFKDVKSKGSSTKNIFISTNAHITTPIHRLIDMNAEEKAEKKIGTTGKGIGPTYVDKYNRKGIRAFDLLDEQKLKEKIENQKTRALKKGEVSDNQIQSSKEDFQKFFDACSEIKKHITDIMPMVHSGKNILIEGAQGTLLDIDHGTYPFVTSSNPSTGGITTGLGLPMNKIDRLIGIFKAYATRVGNGPFPTELFDQDGERLQKIGKEFGATTGRPRRCGWFDIPLANYSIMINGFNEITITKLDILDQFETIKVCTEYELDGEKSNNLSTFINNLDKVNPIYKTIPGWKCSTLGINSFEDLPIEAKDYILYLEGILNVPIKHISTGPKRNDIIIR